MRVAALVLILMSAGSLQAQTPFDGTFSDGQVTVTLRSGAEGYTGRMDVQGNGAVLTARQLEPGILVGTYSVDGRSIPFQVTLDGAGLILQAEGYELALPRQGDAPAEPERSRNAVPRAVSPSPASHGGTIRNEDWGLEFEPPASWTAQAVENGSMYLLGSDALTGFILVMPHQAADLAQLRSEMAEGIQDEGVSIRLTGETRPFGDRGLAGDYEGVLQGQQARGHAAAVLSSHGTGAAVLVLTTTGEFSPDHEEAARSLASGLRFFTPPVPPAVREWKDRIRGRMLSKYDRYSSGGGGGGYTGSTHIDLCVDGTFYFNDNFSASFNSSGSTSGYIDNRRGDAGGWDVVARGGQPTLRLVYADGSVSEYSLGWGDLIPSSSTAHYTALDGSNYLRTPSEKPGCGG